MTKGAANHGRTDSNLAHCPQRFTTCRLTCLPSRLALAGSYPRVPEGRSNWLTKGALVECVVYPKIELRIGAPARAAGHALTDIDVNRHPGIDFSYRDRARIPVGAGVVHGALDGPALERPRQVPDQPQSDDIYFLAR